MAPQMCLNGKINRSKKPCNCYLCLIGFLIFLRPYLHYHYPPPNNWNKRPFFVSRMAIRCAQPQIRMFHPILFIYLYPFFSHLHPENEKIKWEAEGALMHRNLISINLFLQWFHFHFVFLYFAYHVQSSELST